MTKIWNRLFELSSFVNRGLLGDSGWHASTKGKYNGAVNHSMTYK